MRVKTISSDDALRLSAREEDHFFDRKALAVDGRKVQKIAAALANADGGDFLIGVADDKDAPDPSKRWAGATRIEDFNSHLQAITELSPSVSFEYTFLKCEDFAGYVLQVEIPKSSQVHYTADKTVYLRFGAQSLPVKDPQRVVELSFAKGATSYEDQVLSDSRAEDVVEAAEMKQFLVDYSPKSDPLEFTLNQNLLDGVSWKPRVVAAVLFHASPPTIVPKKCGIRLARYETKEEDPERDHLKTTESVEGPAYRLIHDAVQRVTAMMASVSVWTTDGLRPMAYPPEAIWEIVVNAVIHRDYSISDDVQILVFDSRIEVVSPGKLPGYVTPENILSARYTRNPKLVRTLNRYKDPPNKDMGEGLNTAFQKMKEWKLREPVVSIDGNNVKVVIPHLPLAKPSELILEFLLKNDRVTNKQAREITGIRSENKVKDEFYKLRDAGEIEMIPELKGAASAWRRSV